MKAEINKDGMLIIKSETELESYALSNWLRNNFTVAKATNGEGELLGIYNISNIEFQTL